MWQGYNPRLENLETEILKEWEQDDVILRVIRYRIGEFKGKRAMMAGVYGFPKGAQTVPGLLQVHGGGQYADHRAVFSNAKRGYATLSIAWAGRISAPGYSVAPNEVKLFWAGKSDDPKYKLTTDWGALDAYHAPSRNGKDAFSSIPVAEWTIDPVLSPRNNSWFLVTLAGRRGLTFLERQPEVDGEKLGVYGHSMGGKLTVMIAGADERVKAAVPSCGGISDRYSVNELHSATVSDPPSLRRVSCPIFFLSPANDFHGRINDLEKAVGEIQTKDWRVSCSPHHNHQDTPPYEVATQIWFDQHLKATFKAPKTPQAEIILKQGMLPQFSVRPDPNRKVRSVEIYFTQQGILQEPGGTKDDSRNTKHRFWKFIEPQKDSNSVVWLADLPIFSVERPVWAYANVLYDLEDTIVGAGYYYGTYETKTFNLSSLLQVISPDKLSNSGTSLPKARDFMIEGFNASWRKDWFAYNSNKWGVRTNKLYEPRYSAPGPTSRLSLEVSTEMTNKMVLWLDGYGVEFKVLGSGTWQRFSFPLSALKNGEGKSLPSWSGVRELRLDDVEKLELPRGSKGSAVKIGSPWVGEPPEFRNLRWIR
ncbi:dienelactone hydrolase family protein [Candidatus Chordibacter forsetii]|uniref:dienelactone hydrolase family protein n=1 Tax=Candidatus Chordibacter forsetii TaxID=3381758 RepID=UPI003899A7AF